VLKHISGGNVIWIVLAIVLNVLLVYVYYILFEKYDTGIAYPIMKIMAIMIVEIIGIFAYSEKINTRLIVGLIFGTLSLYLLA